jgi:recombination protein RecT
MAEQNKPGDIANKAMAQAGDIAPLEAIIRKSVKELAQSLPAHLNPERVVRIALTSIRLNPELIKCTPESFLGSLFVLAQLGLEPIAGRAYLLPFYNGKTRRMDVQAIIGYKGYVDLFFRHEAALSVDMHEVCEKDDFAFEYGTASYLKHRPAMGERGEVIGYYAVARLKGGASVFLYMTKDDVMEHDKKHSKAWITEKWDDKEKKRVKVDPYFAANSPWITEPDAMCKKTVLAQLAKLLPLSMELQRAITVDETSREFREGIGDAFDLPDTTEWTEPATEQVQDTLPPPQTEKQPPTEKTEKEKQEAVIRGTITDKQIEAIKNLAKGLYKDDWETKLTNRIGAELGVEFVLQLSEDQGKELIRQLSKEVASVK